MTAATPDEGEEDARFWKYRNALAIPSRLTEQARAIMAIADAEIADRDARVAAQALRDAADHLESLRNPPFPPAWVIRELRDMAGDEASEATS